MATARTTDPHTSHLAAHAVERSGRAPSLRDRVLFVVRRRNTGCTAGEIAAELGEQRSEVSKRLPELRDEGLIHDSYPRACAVKGSMMTTWWPGPAQADGLFGGSR